MNKGVLKVSDLLQIPAHAMYGDWALPDREYSYLPLADLADSLLQHKSPVVIRLRDVVGKPGDWFGVDDFSGPRFEQADTRFPCMLVRDMPNPEGLPYRLIDGRRRLEKLRRQGRKSALFYVFEYEEVLPFIVDVSLQPSA